MGAPQDFRLSFNPGDAPGAPPLVHVESSNIESCRWWDEQIYGHVGAANKGQSTMEVWFKATKYSPRRGYYYYGVPQHVFRELLAAGSKGVFLDRHVKKAGVRYSPI